MIPSEIQKTLLGGSLGLIADVGPECWLLYQIMRGAEEHIDRDHLIDGDFALLCSLDFSTWRWQDLFAKESDIVGCAITLKSSSWILDWSFDEQVLTFIVGAHGTSRTYYFLDSLVQRERYAREQARARARVKQPKQNADDRRARASKALARQKVETNAHNEKRREKRLARLAPQWEKMFGHYSDDWVKPRWKDDEAPFGVKLNLEGLWHLYESQFEDKFGRRVDLYTNGRPNKKAMKLKAISVDYDVETAQAAVVYAIENWNEIQSLTRLAKPPTPEVLWSLRHELCFPLSDGADPLEELRRVKKPKNAREEQIMKDEYEESDDDKEVGW